MNRFSFGGFIGLGVALAALSVGSAYGQASAPATASNTKVATLEKFFVNDNKVVPFSGPNVDLPRTINDVQPYFMFDAKEIETSGASTIGEFLQLFLPMNTSTSSLSQNTSIGGVTSSVDLRGLGDGQTLVLVNGRRVPRTNLAAIGGSTQPNLHGIPMGLGPSTE